MSSKNIAILVSDKPGVSETFINNHINKIPYQVTLIYGGALPHKTDGHSESVIVKSYFKLKDALLSKERSYEKYCLSKLLKRKKIDLVFAEYLITGSNAIDICDGLGIPLVVTALGYDISSKSVLNLYGKKYPNLFEKCKNVVVVSNHMRTKLKEYDCSMDKVVYSPAGPDDSFFEIQANLESKNILAIGRFVDKKAPYLTILAFREVLAKVPDAKLIFAGDGYLFGVCTDIVKAMHLEGSINFIGEIDQTKQKELLSDCRMFVQHSKIARNGDSEGTPVAILEASAAGVPIVSTKHAGIVETVSDGATGFLVDEGDVDEMARNMIKLLEDDVLAKKIGAEGREFVKSNFTLKHHIEKISETIKSAL